MPRKKYDDEKLKDEMLALRKRGLSYRQIAKRVGCSTYKVHEILSPLENPSFRLKQAAELAEQVGKLTVEAEALKESVTALKKRVSELNILDDLKAKVSNLDTQLQQLRTQIIHSEERFKNISTELYGHIQKLWASYEAISQRLTEAKATATQSINEINKEILNLGAKLNAIQDTSSVRYEDFNGRISSIEDSLRWINRCGAQRVEGIRACRHVNEEGYCKYAVLNNRVENCRTIEVNFKGQKVYILNVRDKPLICVACPFYKPK